VGYDRRDREPDVPLFYLAAKDPSHPREVADDPLRKAFVRRWSPGIWLSVSAPQWMDEADPNLVVKNLERINFLASRLPKETVGNRRWVTADFWTTRRTSWTSGIAVSEP